MEEKASLIKSVETLTSTNKGLCEQLVELAEPLGYGDLQAFLPYSLVLSSYTTVSQPVSVVAGLEAHFATAVDVSDARGRQMSGRL